jgi:hypothetical protein
MTNDNPPQADKGQMIRRIQSRKHESKREDRIQGDRRQHDGREPQLNGLAVCENSTGQAKDVFLMNS